MKVHVIMCIHVIQNEAGLAEHLKLGANLGFELLTDSPFEEKFQARSHEVVRKLAVLIHQTRNLMRGKDGAPFHQDHMQTHLQRWMRPCFLHCILGAVCAYHETRCCQDSPAVSFDNCFINRDRQPEVIAGYNDLLHGCAPHASLSRRSIADEST